MRVFLLCFLLIGCRTTSTYVYTLAKQGDIIRVKYRMGSEYNSKQLLNHKIKALAESNCASGRWQIANDRLKSRKRNYTYVAPQTQTTNHSGTVGYGLNSTSYSGTSTTTQWNTYRGTTTDYWREADIVCLKSWTQIRLERQQQCKASNDLETCYRVGSAYFLEGNAGKAFEYWGDTCKKGYMVACARIFDATGKYDKAFDIFTRECNSDNYMGCSNSGFMIMNHTAEGSFSEGLEFYKRSCNLGLEEGCDLWRYFKKRGRKVDPRPSQSQDEESQDEESQDEESQDDWGF